MVITRTFNLIESLFPAAFFVSIAILLFPPPTSYSYRYFTSAVEMMKILLLIGLLCALTQQRPISPKKVKWAVNAGSEVSKRAYQGFVFDKVRVYNSAPTDLKKNNNVY